MGLLGTRERRTEFLMACLRVLMGGIFLAVWADNLRKGFYTPDGWADFVQNYADTTRVGLYRTMLEEVMIPNAALFAYGQLVVELVVMGAFVLAGFLTPASAMVGALFQLNLLAATSGTGEWPGTYIIMAAVLLATALSQSGRTLGVDARLAARNPRPRWPLY